MRSSTSVPIPPRLPTIASTQSAFPGPWSPECDRGILICGTGLGISISANKVHGVRCAVCSEPVSAELARQHNDANIIAMGARIIGPVMAEAIVDVFLNTEFQAGRHQRRVDMIMKLDRGESVQ